MGGRRWCSWLMHCPASQEAAGTISDGVIEVFHLHNPSDRTLAVEATQSLKEMSARGLSPVE